MTEEAQKFIETNKLQQEWQDSYYKPDNDYLYHVGWKKVPMKLVPEFDSHIMHQFTDKYCGHIKTSPHAGEEALADGYSDYMIASYISDTEVMV